jgi:hypothetical protein
MGAEALKTTLAVIESRFREGPAALSGERVDATTLAAR